MHFLANSALTQQWLSNAEQNKTISEGYSVRLWKPILDISNGLEGVALQQFMKARILLFIIRR